ADPPEVAVICNALAPHHPTLLDRLWAVAETPEKGQEHRRLRAAAALAKYDPANEVQWPRVRDRVVDDLVKVPAVYLGLWMESLRPVRLHLLTALAVVYRDDKRPEVERSLATELLAEFAADQPNELVNLLLDADEKQFGVVFPKVTGCRDEAIAAFE